MAEDKQLPQCHEIDSLLLASAVSNPTPYLSPVGLIIQDCKASLWVILECSISFVCRLANQAAHLLARAAGSGSFPTC